MFLEKLDKIVHVEDTALRRNGLNLFVGAGKDERRGLHSFAVDVLRKGLAAFLFECRRKVARVDVHKRGNML